MLRGSEALAAGGTVNGTLILNKNAAALPAGPTGTILQLGQADGVATFLDIEAFGAVPQVLFRRANNTNASKTSTASGDNIGTIGARGYTTTNAFGYGTSNKAQISFNADENWTDIAQGARVQINTTPAGSVTPALAVYIDGAGTRIAAGKTFRVGNTYVNTPVVGTGSIVISDDQGTAYRVSCAV